jgi:uncharacterized iron-regulated membrane protein
MLLKFFWALFDLALILVLISGLYLWLSRRRAPIERELDQCQVERAGKIEGPLLRQQGEWLQDDSETRLPQQTTGALQRQ